MWLMKQRLKVLYTVEMRERVNDLCYRSYYIPDFIRSSSVYRIHPHVFLIFIHFKSVHKKIQLETN